MTWLLHNLSKWIGAGALLGISFVFSHSWILGIVGAVWLIVLVQKERALWRAVVGGWTAGTVKAMFSLWWIMTVYPIDWLPQSLSEEQFGVIALCWILSALSVGLSGAGFVLLYWRFKRAAQKNLWILLSTVIVCWFAADLFGSFMYSALSYGPGGGLNLSFSFGYLGYLLVDHELLLATAALGGVYVLNILAAAIVAFIYKLYLMREHMLIGLFLFVLFATSFIPFKTMQTNETAEGHRLAVIETNYSSLMYRTVEGQKQIDEILDEAVSAALEEEFDYILLSEGAQLFDYSVEPSTAKNLFDFLNGSSTGVIVDSGKSTETGQNVLEARVYNGEAGTIETVHKSYLVPQGEYISYTFTGIAKVLGLSEDIKRLDDQMSYRIGPKVNQSGLSPNVPGVLFCLESVSPLGVYNLLKDRPDVPFIAHPISHSWFNDPQTLWHQQNRMLKVQALWNRAYVVTAANQATSEVYTPNGKSYVGDIFSSGDGWKAREVTISH